MDELELEYWTYLINDYIDRCTDYDENFELTDEQYNKIVIDVLNDKEFNKVLEETLDWYIHKHSK